MARWMTWSRVRDRTVGTVFDVVRFYPNFTLNPDSAQRTPCQRCGPERTETSKTCGVAESSTMYDVVSGYFIGTPTYPYHPMFASMAEWSLQRTHNSSSIRIRWFKSNWMQHVKLVPTSRRTPCQLGPPTSVPAGPHRWHGVLRTRLRRTLGTGYAVTWDRDVEDLRSRRDRVWHGVRCGGLP